MATTTLVGVSSPAIAATLHNGSGASCDGLGVFHFVNNQTGTRTPGTLTAEFTDGTQMVTPSKINKNVQHFYVESTGTLIDAETNLDGRLVLSDFTCEEDSEKK